MDTDKYSEDKIVRKEYRSPKMTINARSVFLDRLVYSLQMHIEFQIVRLIGESIYRVGQRWMKC
jgi:hypothetical protein